MASQSLSRKRPAPGASLVPYQQQHITNGYGGIGPQLSNDQFLQWGQTPPPSSSFSDASLLNISNKIPANGEQPLNQLARRPASQVANRGRGYPDSDGTQLSEPTNGTGQPTGSAWSEDLDDLKQKAQIAKKEAQAKRKQIPPFVQKLSSFLDESKNTELIRWSDDGNSFVVLDEDEFAKTLIPELFKHNNYASFVRQLNMYGFHKKVGLSDNSMKASERKNKSPSEYSNPYFRRGHHDLLWLIQKPKNITGQGNKAKSRNKADSEQNEDHNDEYAEDVSSVHDGRPGPRTQLAIGQGESTISQEQLASIQRELQAIRRQQAQITTIMTQLKREHEQLYGQAATFQDQHTRHENSINAILTFLATVYNRSLQGHEGIQGIANLFAGSIPHEASQGNVVDVGDYSFDQLNADASVPKPYKKQPLLLQAPQAKAQEGRASTIPATSIESPHPRRQTRRASQGMRTNHAGQPGSVEELFESHVNTPTAQQRDPVIAEQYPQRDIMSVIQNSNARHSLPGTPQDFSNMLESLENSGGNTPLTSSQRADMLRLINNTSNQVGDNALVSPNPPPMPTSFDRSLASTKADLENLAKMQAEQDRSVQNLTNLLQPLSPTGSIPGIGDGTNVQPPPLDIDDFLNHSDYFQDFPIDGNFDFGDSANTNGNGLHFAGLHDGDDELFGDVGTNGQQQQRSNDYEAFSRGKADDDDGGGRVESVTSSEVTTPANTTDNDGISSKGKSRHSSDGGRSSTKRRKRNT